MKVGIVGLPNVGKSTLFAAITRMQVPIANYPFCTIEHHEAIVEVPEPRLPRLKEIGKSNRSVSATITFVDIAGLVKGASEGEGLGNQFLANVRDVDLILHCVRCFEDMDTIHVAGRVDPIADAETIQLELILADLQSIQSISTKVEKQLRTQKERQLTFETLKKMEAHLFSSKPLLTLYLTEEERAAVKEFPFLTAKPMLYVANVSEEDLSKETIPLVEKLKEFLQQEVLIISAKIEEELSQLGEQESAEFLLTLGLKESGLQRIIRRSYEVLQLITFFTVGEMEARAWTIKKGMTAPEAAGKIHSDIEKGFIRAEVIPYETFIICGSRAKAREEGCARSEGKTYSVQDGDVILFFHHS